MSNSELTNRRILAFWLPLAGTWLMMSVEGPFLTAVIARLPNPTENLAAYGIAFVLALVVESPVIQFLSASTALVSNRATYGAMRRFAYRANVLLTLVLLLILLPPVFRLLSEGLLKLPGNVAALTHNALILLVPWPAAIGYRRFHQGLLVRNNLTRMVAVGTVMRVVTMAITALLAARFTPLSGASVGAFALSCGVIAEAVATGLMTHLVPGDLRFRNIEEGEQEESSQETPEASLSQAQIFSFYVPLSLTSILALGVQPIVTFFLGQSRFPLESLALFPVVQSFTFIFRSVGISFQEVGIALLGDRGEHYRELRNFVLMLATLSSAALALVAYTPLVLIWYGGVAGLPPELIELAITPTRMLIILPGITVLISFQRALLINARNTPPLGGATLTEIATIATVLFVGIWWFDMIGVYVAALALVLGRLLGNIYLVPHVWRLLQERGTRF
jgi:hypothetical protein